MLKKVLSMTIAVAMSVSIFAGCAKSSDKSPVSVGSGSQDQKLKAATIKFWFPSEGEVNDKYFMDAAKEFETKYPQIKVEVTKLPASAGDVTVKLNAAALSGDYPDVQSTFLAHIASRGSKDELADLKPYLDKWEDKGDIEESSYSAGLYKDKQLGIGFYPSPKLLVYRTDYFKEANLDPAKPPKNWNELKDYAYKLVKKDANGKVIRAGLDIFANNETGSMLTYMRQGGSSVVDSKGEKPSITDSGAAEGFSFLVGMKDQSIPYDGARLDDFPFMKGNAAMSLLNLSQVNKMISLDPSMKEKLGFAPVLETSTKVTFNGNRLFTMAESSKVKEQSWEFIKFMLSKEQTLKRAKELNIPVVRKSLEKDYIALDAKLNTANIEYIKYGVGMPQVSWVSMLSKYVDVAYQEAYSGKKTAQEALKDADTAINKELQTLQK